MRRLFPPPIFEIPYLFFSTFKHLFNYRRYKYCAILQCHMHTFPTVAKFIMFNVHVVGMLTNAHGIWQILIIRFIIFYLFSFNMWKVTYFIYPLVVIFWPGIYYQQCSKTYQLINSIQSCEPTDEIRRTQVVCSALLFNTNN